MEEAGIKALALLGVGIPTGFSEGKATGGSRGVIIPSFSLDKIHDELRDFGSSNDNKAMGVFDSFFSDSEGDFDNELGDPFKEDDHHGELCEDARSLYASYFGFT